jgi:HSP20 family protein
MAIVKAAPKTATLRRDMNRFFDRFFDRPFPVFEPETVETTWMPSLDFTEKDNDYVVRLEVPEIPKENLDVSMDGNVLIVSGHRESTEERKNERYLWREREEGAFQRSVRIPKPVKAADIKAVCHDGVLTVTLPKEAAEVKNKILIK